MKHILITGASGFVGRVLCRRLLDDGLTVVAGVRTADVTPVLPRGVVPVVMGNLETFHDWPAVLDHVDGVVHLAARAHVLRETETDPLASYRRVNVDGTRNVLDACHDSSVRRLIYLSSIGVVGRGSSQPYRESDPCQPEDSYAQSKYEAEQLLVAGGKQGNLETVILRPPLVYGPGVGANFLRIMNLVWRGLPLPLGRVKSYRSLVFVENLVDAIRLCLSHPHASGEIFHVADRYPMATTTLVKTLAENYGRPAPMWPLPIPLLQVAGMCLRKNIDVDRLVRTLTMSTEKIERVLCWNPVVTTEEGVRRTVEAYLLNESPEIGKSALSRRAA